jgi:hypothetical protein
VSAELGDVLAAKEATQVAKKNERHRLPMKIGERDGFAGVEENFGWHFLKFYLGRTERPPGKRRS